MANVINRTNLTLHFSVDPHDYPVNEWIVNPDLSKVIDVPRQFWKIVGDSVLPMTRQERDAVTAAEADAAKQGEVAMLDQRISVAVLTVLVQQINQLRQAQGLPIITRQQFRTQVYQALQ